VGDGEGRSAAGIILREGVWCLAEIEQTASRVMCER